LNIIEFLIKRFKEDILLKRLKWILGFVMVSVLFCVSPVVAAPTVQLDGRQLYFDVPPVIDNGRTLVPLRVIFEAMGATVAWDDATKTVTAIKGNTTVILKLGSTTPKVNGVVKTLDVPAKAVSGENSGASPLCG
jgi:hypothetical protein